MDNKSGRGKGIIFMLIMVQLVPFCLPRPIGPIDSFNQSGKGRWVEDAELDQFAEEITNLVVKTELPFLKGIFWMLLCILTKYFIWPPAKYWFYVCKRKCKYYLRTL
jgi:hypothetical protein